MSISAVVFDLWDTLVPLPKTLRERGSKALTAALGAPPETFATAWSDTRVERETGELEPVAARICRDLGLTLSDDAVRAALQTRISIQREAFAAMRPDAVSTLRMLRAMGVRVGLISNCTDESPRVVGESPLAPLLDAAVFSCTEKLMKPDLRLYQRAAQLLDVPPDECLYVGDGSDDELPGAQAAGMTAVLFDPGDTPVQEWGGLRVSALSQLPSLLERRMAPLRGLTIASTSTNPEDSVAAPCNEAGRPETHLG